MPQRYSPKLNLDEFDLALLNETEPINALHNAFTPAQDRFNLYTDFNRDEEIAYHNGGIEPFALPRLDPWSQSITNIYSSPLAKFADRKDQSLQRREYKEPRQTDLTGLSPISTANEVEVSLKEVLLPKASIPEQFRSVFPFEYFNEMQSKCYDIAFKSGENMLVSAPTGSGKTVIFELAIVRLNACQTNRKTVYVAPTKSLCTERRNDWQKKFSAVGLSVCEITGDTDPKAVSEMKNADIIVTTPEKWDSVTRAWHDRRKLMSMVSLFLIDEVHILKEARGATLEAIVSRMKAILPNVRFLAISARVKNLEDIASWIGSHDGAPSFMARFDDSYRAVPLEKVVLGYQWMNLNEFAFEKELNKKLLDVIDKYSAQKPALVFCSTRRGTTDAAKAISEQSSKLRSNGMPWQPQFINVAGCKDKVLKECLVRGVGFHHAGLSLDDRSFVEKLFLRGDLYVLCCTSTLATGVNLPARLVVIRNTLGWIESKQEEYSEISILQMCGRAGRAQFDDQGIAVIMTRSEKVDKYHNFLNGMEVIESCLQSNLAEHMNSEICLRTITDCNSAVVWLRSSFFHVRLRQNPRYYGLSCTSEMDIDKTISKLCTENIDKLKELKLVTTEKDELVSTVYGEASARYHVKINTMAEFISLSPTANLKMLLECICKAEEFDTFRLKHGEKTFYNTVNRLSAIRFPFEGKIERSEQKISLLIQLSKESVTWNKLSTMKEAYGQMIQHRLLIFRDIVRITKCMVDALIESKGAVAIMHGICLLQSVQCRCWGNSAGVLRQIANVGEQYCRTLESKGVKSFEGLQNTNASELEVWFNRNPPFGMQLLKDCSLFPRFSVNIKLLDERTEDHIIYVQCQVTVNLMNKDIRTTNPSSRRQFHVILLGKTSENRLISFERVRLATLQHPKVIVLEARVSRADVHINFHVISEDIAGCDASCEFQLRPAVLNNEYKKSELGLHADLSSENYCDDDLFSNLDEGMPLKLVMEKEDEAALCDENPLAKSEHEPLESDEVHAIEDGSLMKMKSEARVSAGYFVSRKLYNGNYECNHKCKNRKTCKHRCCRIGLKKPVVRRISNTEVGYASPIQKRSRNSHQDHSSNKSKSDKRSVDNIEFTAKSLNDFQSTQDVADFQDIQIIDLTMERPTEPLDVMKKFLAPSRPSTSKLTSRSPAQETPFQIESSSPTAPCSDFSAHLVTDPSSVTTIASLPEKPGPLFSTFDLEDYFEIKD